MAGNFFFFRNFKTEKSESGRENVQLVDKKKKKMIQIEKFVMLLIYLTCDEMNDDFILLECS